MSNSGKKMVYLRKKGTSGKQTIEFTYADANYLHLDRPNNFGGGGGGICFPPKTETLFSQVICLWT